MLLAPGRLLTSVTAAARPGGPPSLDLNFLAGSMPPTVTFSRASIAYSYNSSGVLVAAPLNLLLRSAEFDNASWVKTAATISANATTAPDGTTTADKFVESSATAVRAVYGVATVAASTVHTFSIHVKAAERTVVQLVYDDGSTHGCYANFDLTTGATPGIVARSSGVAVSASIVSVGSGWYRCSVTGSFGTTSARCAVTPVPTTGASAFPSYAGDGTSGLHLWGAQLEAGTTATSYIGTTSAAAYGPRFDYDPATLAPRGLLVEEARTNLLLRSQEFDNASWTKTNASISANSATAPDGTTTADLVSGTAPTVHASQSVSISSGATVTVSVFAKPGASNHVRLRVQGGAETTSQWFNVSTGAVGTTTASANIVLSGQTNTSVGNGWWRVSATYATTGFTSLTVGVGPANFDAHSGDAGHTAYVWGAQLEAGSFATSYIPTTSATATRAADTCSMPVGGWYSATEGTLFAEATAPMGGSGQRVAVLDDGTASLQFFLNRAPSHNGFIRDASGAQANFTPSTWADGSLARLALAWRLNDVAFSANGAAPSLDTAALIPVVTTLRIGAQSNGAYFGGHVRRVAYFKRRLDNATLQAITR